MKNLLMAIEEEKEYIKDKMSGRESSLSARLAPLGYEDLTTFFNDKRNYLFNEWHPEIIRIDAKTLTTELENAVQNKKYGVYLSFSDGLYAFHGNELIDYDLCKELGIHVAELYHNGGTIIGSNEDLGIEIVAPSTIRMDSAFVLNKIQEILSKYFHNVEIVGNDIMINQKKVLGSMERHLGEVYVWAAQISFGNYEELIQKVCNKPQLKTPGFIDSNLLSKEKLEKEILQWLQSSI